MRLGLIVRADNRGLGNQTWELHRHLKPVKTMIVAYPNISPYRHHMDRYPADSMVVTDTPPWSDALMNAFLDGIDVLLTCETPYDYRFFEIARRRGVLTVLQYNWEFFRYIVDTHLPRPDILLAPSEWYIDRVPDAVYLPLPVARDRLPFRLRTRVENFLHVAGHPAAHDRNGTGVVLDAARFMRQGGVRVIVHAQRIAQSRIRPRRVVDLRVGDISDYPKVYAAGDVFLMPRRYGGQSLAFNEAMACGMVPLISDVSPQREFVPEPLRVPGIARRTFTAQSGEIPIFDTSPQALAQRMDELVTNHSLVELGSRWADAWADAHSWDALLPAYLEVLEGHTDVKAPGVVPWPG